MGKIPVPLLPKRVRAGIVVIVAVAILYYSTIGTPPGTIGGASGNGGGGGSGSWLTTNHATGYAVLAYSLAYALADDPANDTVDWRTAGAIITVASAYGFFLEVTQLFFLNRFFDTTDIASNIVGATVVLWWYVLEPYIEFVPIGSSET